jgi:histidinol-phosphate aminotransferase
MVVLVAPNNPTGGSPSQRAVDAALDDEARLVFIDEAYADFAGETRIGEVEHHPNLVVGRSLSKALLADVRLGCVVAHPDIVGALEQIFTAPYHLNAMQLVVAERYADIAPHVEASVAAVVAERERVTVALTAMDGIDPHPSRANFVLFRVDGERQRSHAVYDALAKAGVRIRDVGGLPGLASYLRVTIGTAADNDAFLVELASAL